MAPMDKQAFLNLAPEYYMLALYIHLQSHADYYTDSGWQKDFSHYDEDAAHEYCYVSIDALRAEAFRLMQEHGSVTVIEDPFGPTIWQKTGSLDDLSDQLENSQASVFFRAKVSGDPKGWLYSALQKLNLTADELQITSADFQQKPIGNITLEATIEVKDPEPVDEWAPITIDQTNPAVSEATKQLNAATEAIEQDNGYSATHPQERDAVVTDLKGGLEKMKSGVVSVNWVRRTVLALKIGGFRFANTMKGQIIDGALAALKDVVKNHMGHVIEALIKLFT